ncbi:hypothetical protein EfmAA242_24370 [Enterococcus faecium]|nr:hypothetical protein EfmAA242_24370 [Enterococcus faecium]
MEEGPPFDINFGKCFDTVGFPRNSHGTLVTNRSKALESTKQAIEYARKNGILCGVASGRSPVKIKEIIDELELDMYVVYNGQLVFTADRTIIDHPFEQKVLEHIVEFADENHRQIVFGASFE